MSSPITRGIHHVGLTVSKLEESAAFFTTVLGWKEVRRNDYPAIYVSDGQVLVTLWRAVHEPVLPFDRKRNVGLHHLALSVDSEAALLQVHQLLVQANVQVEFPPEPIGKGPAQHMMCFDPSGIRLEFIWLGQ